MHPSPSSLSRALFKGKKFLSYTAELPTLGGFTGSEFVGRVASQGFAEHQRLRELVSQPFILS